jgi:hypothetical protein
MRVPTLTTAPAPFLLLALAACAGDGPSAPTADDLGADPASIRSEVPMKGSYEGTGNFTTPPAGCAGLFSAFTGTGRETHTGRYRLTQTVCTVPIDATTFAFTGEFTKTAANGDLLRGTFEGTSRLIQPPGPTSPIGVFEVAGTIVFTGGTGRFDGATGSQRMSGTQWTDFSQAHAPSRMVLEFDGTISTIGSLRSAAKEVP